MNNTLNSSMLDTVKTIFDATQETVDGLKDGERIQIKQLAETVGSKVSMEPKVVLGFVNYFVHNTSVVYVTRGKNGGIIKGTRPAKVVKPGKKAKSDSTDSTPAV